MDTNITIAVVSASSVVVGGLATALIQHLLTTATTSREEKRHRRLDFRNRFEDCVVKLLEETDPDIHPVSSVPEIKRNVIRLQLYLDLEDKDHRKLNGHLNSLASSLSGYSDPQKKSLILRNHAALLEAASKVFKKYNS